MKKRPEIPDSLPPPSELSGGDVRFSNELVDAILAAIKKYDGACSRFEIIGALRTIEHHFLTRYREDDARDEREDDDVEV